MNRLSAAGVIFVDDIERIAAFYQAVASMERLHADSDHVVLGIAGFQLTVHALPFGERNPKASGYPSREDSYLKLCFPVADLADARLLAASLGGELWSSEQEWQARGFRACDGRDPEGNIFQLRQHAS